MTQLTREEKELYEKATSLPFLADDESSVVPGLIRAIDRLSARLNEYEADRKEARDCTATFWMNYGEKVGGAHLDAEDKATELSARVEELQVEKEIAESLSRFGDSPCGHSSQYAYTEDGGKHIICLLCRSNRVEEMEAEVATAWGEAGDNMRNGVDLIKGLQAELSIAQGFQVAKQDEINRLSARVEEIEQQKGMLKILLGDARNERLLKVSECAALQANLSTLLSAVEPIVKWLQYGDHRPNDQKLLGCNTHDEVMEYVTVSDLRTLATVAAGIKEGKK